MTDIEIDPTTGLPSLPEGQRWRVGKGERYMTTRAYEVSLQRLETEDVITVVKRRRFLADVVKTETVSTWVWVDSRWIGDDETDENGESILEDVSYNTGYHAGILQRPEWAAVKDLTPADILRFATEIAEEQEKARARQENEKKLLGTYPPLRLSDDA